MSADEADVIVGVELKNKKINRKRSQGKKKNEK